ncbi:MAG: FAD:protein FMN transferase, partial [Candidatus Omnitrophica bacterium]|nr:FAD:protein FMN transferase [Candidatus Omnitrophota bacterium]
GYAVDCAIKKLKQAGIKSVLINAGGDIYCMGANRNLIWRVAVQNPQGKGRKTTLQLSDKAVATAGDYERNFTLDGKDYCSIIDPKTGMPSESGLSAVSVIANDCLSADAAAASIFILGKKKGMEFIQKVNGASCAVLEAKNVPDNR